MVDGGTSCTATRLTGSSASLCRNALLAAMLSPKLETEKAHKKAALTQKRGTRQTRDSQQRWEVWEGRGFEQQGQSHLDTLSVVGRQGQ